jgi:uncharacterized protein (DUF302 family)
MPPFANVVELTSGFDQTLANLPPLLAEQGFGVLTEVDVTGVLAKKLGLPFRRYRILGACNPQLAHRALQANLLAGVMMPCNLVVWERDDGGSTVATIDPRQAPAAAADPAIAELANEVQARLEKLLRSLSA